MGRGAEGTEFFDIMACDAPADRSGDSVNDGVMDEAREHRREHIDAPPFVKALSLLASDIWLGAEEMVRDAARMVAAAAGPPPRAAAAQPAQPAPWPAPPKTPPTRGASAAESTPMRSTRTKNKDVDRLDTIMEMMMMRNKESVHDRFDCSQERMEEQVADPTSVTRTATRLRQAKMEYEGKVLWANMDRTREERVRVRPVRKLIAQLRQAQDILPQSLRAENDAEGGWRQHAEHVRLTTNKWKTSSVVGKMGIGGWEEFSHEQMLTAMGCEWFARLREVRMEDGN